MSIVRFLPGLLVVVASLGGCSKASSSPPPPSDASDGRAPKEVAAPPAEVDAAPPAPKDPFAGGPWNVVLITVDCLRADKPWNGYPRPITPNLSALHARSIVYDRGYSFSSFTSKSLSALLAGRYASSLERSGFFFTKLLPSNKLFCETLDEQGIACAAGHAHAYLDAKMSGFDQGFRSWKLVTGITFDYNTDPYVTSQKLAPLAIETLGSMSALRKPGDGEGRPFFAWFHFMDPHDDYKGHPESPHFGGKARDLDDEEVFYTDLWIGKLLDYVESQPWAARTVIAVSADHGETFGEHFMTRHAHELWEELVHVPLFFYVPGAKRRVISEPRGHVDLAPTFLELLGAKADPSLPGVSLVAELRGEDVPPRDVIVDLPQDEYNDRRRALINGKYKLIVFNNDSRFLLFDLESDPHEAKDLMQSRPDIAKEMKARYRAASQKIPEVSPAGGIPKHE